ncbi:MAG: RlmE family RNA methyltransferase [Gammaproteobacteria bacterium]
MTTGRKGKRRWAQSQAHDPWVRKARAQGLPSRSAFKLEEIVSRFGLLKTGQAVLELGAAPGGWTRIAVASVGALGRVVAVDRLPMTPPAGARFVLGDLADETTRAEALAAIGGAADVVLCDLAPNLTGIRDVDAANEAELGDLAAGIAAAALKPGGVLLLKTFEGPAAAQLQHRLRGEYRRVRHLKPAASKARSREFYLLAEGFRPGPEIAAERPGAL